MRYLSSNEMGWSPGTSADVMYNSMNLYLEQKTHYGGQYNYGDRFQDDYLMRKIWFDSYKNLIYAQKFAADEEQYDLVSPDKDVPKSLWIGGTEYSRARE